MSAQAVGRHMPSVVTLDDLAPTGEYEVVTKLPLAWLLNTAPADHLG